MEADRKLKHPEKSHKGKRHRKDGKRLGELALTKDSIEQMIQLYTMGYSDNDVADIMKITRQAIYEHIKRHPDSLLAKKEQFKKKRLLEVREKLYSLTKSDDEGIALKACIDYLNRYEGKPKEKLELTGDISTSASKAIEENLAILAKLYERDSNK